MNSPKLLRMLLVAIVCAMSRPTRAETPPRLPEVALPVFPAHRVNLADYGGVGDGRSLNTAAFARALKALADQGGGELIVPAGFWLTGPIQLGSNINLHLERGALIQFSRDYRRYPLVVINVKGERAVDATSPISGQNLENVGITGEGILDGGGDAWRMLKKEKLGEREWESLVKSGGVVDAQGKTWYPSREAMDGGELVGRLRAAGSQQPADYEPAHPFLRPRMLRLIGCRKVLLQGVTFQNPPNWTLNPALCQDVSILQVTVHNSPAAQNSDALDLESCQRARIQDCVFEAGDDGICLKSGKDAVGRRIGEPTEDVLVEGCTVYHAHGGFVIGSEMSGGVRNVWVNNCTFMGTDVGLRFKSSRGRGGVVERIFVTNVRMESMGEDAINFNLYYGGKPALEDAGTPTTDTPPPVTAATPQFRDIHLENIVCRGAQSAIRLQGLPEMPLQNVTLKNVDITAQRGVSVTDAENIQFAGVRVETTGGAPLTQLRVKDCVLELVK